MKLKSYKGLISMYWKWILYTSISINILLLIFIFYKNRSNSVDLGDLISISSGLVSIALAIVAIIYSISESIKNDNKENKLNDIIYKVNNGVMSSQRILKKVNSANDCTSGILEKMSDQFNSLQDSVSTIQDMFEQLHLSSEENSSENLISETNNNGENSSPQTNNIESQSNNDKIESNMNNSYVTNIYKETVIKKDELIKCKRGEIYYADLSPVIGSEQGGIRPVIIIQNNIGNTYSPTVIVMALTSQINKPKLPTHVEISKDKFNYTKDSVALAEQIRTLDKRRLKEKIGELDYSMMSKINTAINIALDLKYIIK